MFKKIFFTLLLSLLLTYKEILLVLLCIISITIIEIIIVKTKSNKIILENTDKIGPHSSINKIVIDLDSKYREVFLFHEIEHLKRKSNEKRILLQLILIIIAIYFNSIYMNFILLNIFMIFNINEEFKADKAVFDNGVSKELFSEFIINIDRRKSFFDDFSLYHPLNYYRLPKEYRFLLE